MDAFLGWPSAETEERHLNTLFVSFSHRLGREWALFKRLPAILLLGTALPIGLALALWWAAPGQPSAAEQRDLLLLTYRLIGLVILHWTVVFTLAIGCAIVLLMKGSAFAADAFPPPGRERTAVLR